MATATVIEEPNELDEPLPGLLGQSGRQWGTNTGQIGLGRGGLMRGVRERVKTRQQTLEQRQSQLSSC